MGGTRKTGTGVLASAVVGVLVLGGVGIVVGVVAGVGVTIATGEVVRGTGLEDTNAASAGVSVLEVVPLDSEVCP
jgi:hypothetical protein